MRCVLFVLVLVRIRVQRKALVRTLHNAVPHDELSWVHERIVAMADRATTVWLLLSDQVAPLTDAPAVVAPHGHYRDWFAETTPTPAVPGRLLFFGRIRRYKGVHLLLAAFARLEDDRASLHVVGKTEDDELADDLRRAEAADHRITAIDDFVDDEVLSREVFESELVVLPFVEMTNSGSMLLALSLDRPVLVPRRPVTGGACRRSRPGLGRRLRRRARRHHDRARSAPSPPRATRPLGSGLGTDRVAPRPRVPAGHGLMAALQRVDPYAST